MLFRSEYGRVWKCYGRVWKSQEKLWKSQKSAMRRRTSWSIAMWRFHLHCTKVPCSELEMSHDLCTTLLRHTRKQKLTAAAGLHTAACTPPHRQHFARAHFSSSCTRQRESGKTWSRAKKRSKTPANVKNRLIRRRRNGLCTHIPKVV